MVAVPKAKVNDLDKAPGTQRAVFAGDPRFSVLDPGFQRWGSSAWI